MTITNIALGIITLLGAILTYFVIPLIKIYFLPYLKSKLTKPQLEILSYWVEVAIRYFEVKIDGSAMGSEKKKQVLKFLQDKNLTILEDDLDKIIDAMVEQFNKNGWK